MSRAAAERLMDEFLKGLTKTTSVALPISHGLAAVLRHLAVAHGDPESFGAVRPELLEQLAAELEGMG